MAEPVSIGTRLIRQLLGKPVPPPPGRIPAMLAARRAMVDAPYMHRFEGLDLPDGGWMPTRKVVSPRLVARDGSGIDYEDAAFLAQRAEQILAGKNAEGFFDPEYNFVVYPVLGDRAREVRRHEVMHGYNAAAQVDGSRLPLAARLTGALRAGGNTGGFGRVFDELVAHRTGGRRFSEIPWHVYGEQYAAEGDPLASRIALGLDGARRAGRVAYDRSPYLAGGATSAGLVGYELLRKKEDAAEGK